MATCSSAQMLFLQLDLEQIEAALLPSVPIWPSHHSTILLISSVLSKQGSAK